MSYEETNRPGMASETVPPSSGLPGSNMNRVVHEFRELANDHLELATLETRLSVNTLLRMAIISIFTALVLVSAWLTLVGSAALGLISFGLAPVMAMLLLAAANLIIALLGWLQVRRMSLWLGWPATQRAIMPAPAAEQQRDEE